MFEPLKFYCMWPDWVSKPGPLALESGALPTALPVYGRTSSRPAVFSNLLGQELSITQTAFCSMKLNTGTTRMHAVMNPKNTTLMPRRFKRIFFPNLARTT